MLSNKPFTCVMGSLPSFRLAVVHWSTRCPPFRRRDRCPRQANFLSMWHHFEWELRLGPCYPEMADSLSLNREVVRGVLCPDISSPAASLLVADSLYLDRKVIRGILCRLLHVASDIPRNGNSLRNRSSTVLCSMCSAAYLGHPWVR